MDKGYVIRSRLSEGEVSDLRATIEAQARQIEALNGLLAKSPKWQTIDTAPRHQRIIVGRAAVRVGTATLPAFCGEAFWSESKQAWCFHSEFFARPVMEYDNPTHWMPLPTPPGDDK